MSEPTGWRLAMSYWHGYLAGLRADQGPTTVTYPIQLDPPPLGVSPETNGEQK